MATPETTPAAGSDVPPTVVADVVVPTTPVVDSVTAKLKSLGVTDDQVVAIKALGAETVEDLGRLTEADLTSVGVKVLKARSLLKALRPEPEAPTAAAAAAAGVMGASSFDAVLPPVPSESSWLESLRIGGVLKVESTKVIAAVRAALAHRAGLFEIPDRLVAHMERFADENEEQVPTEFFKLRKQLVRRNYAEIFEAIEGLDGNFVTEARKRELLSRIDESMWPAISGFYTALNSWQQAWMQGAANPAMMMAAFFTSSGGGAGILPPGMMAPPDTGTLRDNADEVNNAINRVFRGTGVHIASAIAYDASRIKETLENDRLPAMVGAANRDQMLRQLGVGVSATYPRLETNLTRFVLGVIQLKDQPAGTEELRYLSALFMLGSQIPWDQLGSSTGAPSRKVTGIGGTRRAVGDREI